MPIYELDAGRPSLVEPMRPAASLLVRRCLDWMSALYGTTVFDEWAVVTVGSAGASLGAYEGPRSEQFRSRFLADAHALRPAICIRGRSRMPHAANAVPSTCRHQGDERPCPQPPQLTIRRPAAPA